MAGFRVFVDSDVIISCLLSKKGAAYFLLKKQKEINFYFSNFSLKELKRVCKRLDLNKSKLNSLIKDSFSQIKLKNTLKQIKKNYSPYTKDIDDSHIVAGAKKAKANFLISYNKKDYQIERVKKDFGIIILSPGEFLQYLRSLN